MSSPVGSSVPCELPPPEPPYAVYCKSCRAKRALSYRAARCACWGLLVIFAIFKLLYWIQQADDAFFREHGSTYPTSFNILKHEFSGFSHWTHDTVPVTCYSHNDRGRPISLQSAISSGCTSIKMTIFPSGDEVLIGPNPHMLSRAMNLRGRYIDPLLSMIRENRWEPETVPSGARSHERQQLPGVFQEDPTQSLVLLMNFGADPEWTWSQLIPQLESLREAGFLTHFNGSAIVQGPITIVATGNVSFYRILETSTFRDIFFDAPLLQLVAFDDQDFLQGSDYSFRNSYYASADFLAAIGNVNANGFSNKQLADVRQQVRLAHGLGLKVRYVITSHWPYHLRNYVWRMLVREGVDIVTVDGLSH